ncbi:MAG: zf-HC2 domain-containing protein [Phycisphaerae bacterium]|nr:zf-HC2 domain-containing protein [Phycisphaerae bacterium]
MTMTPCKEFADRIVDYVDGELPADEAQVVGRHLGECDRCRRTAEALQRSLGLAKVIWLDNLAEPAAAAPARRVQKLHRRSFYVLAIAASILLATGVLLIPVSRRDSGDRPITAEQIERQVARVGIAAELLAATRIVAQCEGTESIVQQQYRYILREYADTPAAESIKANHDLKLGGTQND